MKRFASSSASAQCSTSSFSRTLTCKLFSTSTPSVSTSSLSSSTSSVFSSQSSPSSSSSKMSVKLSLSNDVGSLSEALSQFSRHKMRITKLESRPSKKPTPITTKSPSSSFNTLSISGQDQDLDLFVDFLGESSSTSVNNLLKDLKLHASLRDAAIVESKRVGWFPSHAKDLDLVTNYIMEAGAELQSDHPGFHDPEYRERRATQVQNALDYRHGDLIPRVDYNAREISTWGMIYNRLLPLVTKYGCDEYVKLLPVLQKHVGFREDNIPQLQDVSDFLKSTTGFTIRPVAGMLTSRDFLYGLAFRTFFSTQYIRHYSKPLYTPEPDLVHELMGHAVMLADQSYADFCQEIGLASIGASDEQIAKLARCFWFTVEFGLCRQNDKTKVFGAALLSSFGELEYAMGLDKEQKPQFKPWDPFVASEQDYPYTKYQPLYFVSNSFEESKLSMQNFSNSFARPFYVRYNHQTQSLDVDGNISVDEYVPTPSFRPQNN